MRLEEVFQPIFNDSSLLITESGFHIGVETPDRTLFPSNINFAKTLYTSCGIKNPENP